MEKKFVIKNFNEGSNRFFLDYIVMPNGLTAHRNINLQDYKYIVHCNLDFQNPVWWHDATFENGGVDISI